MGGSKRLYESIGVGYAAARRPDPRVAEQILDAIGPLGPVLNVGAGTGNYEPESCPVVAVEPASSVIGQRLDRVRTVRAVAEQLPFADCSFEAAMAIFTIHHWSDARAGLRPERYLEPAVQAGMSTLARLTPQQRQTGTERLRAAVESGEWDQRHGTLRAQPRFDMGYRLVVSHSRQRPDADERR